MPSTIKSVVFNNTVYTFDIKVFETSLAELAFSELEEFFLSSLEIYSRYKWLSCETFTVETRLQLLVNDLFFIH